MDVIQVDPKLFVTCRLCLEDLGLYQIVPTVQQQIKYCFDIDVEPFDGLPQLVCVKCKEILNKFYAVKKSFCEKQSNLLTKVTQKDNKEVNQICVQPQQDTVSSSQQNAENIDETIISKPKKKKILHSSSSDFESEQSYLVAKPKLKKKFSKLSLKKRPTDWEADYSKQIVCKICNTLYPSKRSIWNHLRGHAPFRAKYKNILDRQCTVTLNKIDEKPNITGSNMVVLSTDKIIETGSSYFYTVYSKKETDHVNNADELHRIRPGKSSKKRSIQDSTDDDEEIISKRKPRVRRIVSRSSNETVVIESNSNKILSDMEDSKMHDNIDRQISNDQCINIDDSSDSESEKVKFESAQNLKQPMEAQLVDYKIIQGIISMCVNAYHKKHEIAEVEGSTNVKKNDKVQVSRESQLKHKVLSIGRKIINKQGFNCTGLLRYMEHKNLEIVWMTKTLPSYSNKEPNYIRILTKLRGHDTPDDNQAWVNICKPTAVPNNSIQVTGTGLKNLLDGPSTKPFSADPLGACGHDSSATIIETSQLAKIEKCQPEVKPHVEETLPAMLYLDHDSSSSDLKKLLNANPVANPKQLPKKLGPGSESRSSKAVAQQNTCHPNNDDNNFCMPIITSTTSLATVPIKEHIEDANQNNNKVSSALSTNKEAHAPRIKVKPASELMSERILNNLMKEQSAPAANSNMAVSQIENVWPHQHSMNVYVPNIAPQIHVGAQPIQIVQLPCVNVSPTYHILPSPTISNNVTSDYVILDTIQFPNTKTESPFKYLKDVLQTHNLILLDPCNGLSRDYVCLIKFKVLFKQEANKDQPVVLCLSLFCKKNIFCLKVRDRNQENIDINKISANWQWEILQIYTGDVTNKVLQNAQKISQETYEFTKSFVCLLKSINCKKKS